MRKYYPKHLSGQSGWVSNKNWDANLKQANIAMGRASFKKGRPRPTNPDSAKGWDEEAARAAMAIL